MTRRVAKQHANDDPTTGKRLIISLFLVYPPGHTHLPTLPSFSRRSRVTSPMHSDACIAYMSSVAMQHYCIHKYHRLSITYCTRDVFVIIFNLNDRKTVCASNDFTHIENAVSSTTSLDAETCRSSCDARDGVGVPEFKPYCKGYEIPSATHRLQQALYKRISRLSRRTGFSRLVSVQRYASIGMVTRPTIHRRQL